MTKTGKYSTHPARNAGFTLIELMVVLVLLALLAGMIAPTAVSALRRTGVSSRGEDLVEMLCFAQRYAITSHHPVQVDFDSRTGRCRVFSVVTAFPWLESGGSGKPEVLATLEIPANLHLTVRSEAHEAGGDAARQRITFASDGRADQASLRLVDERGGSYEIRVMAADGAVQGRDGPAP